MPFRYVKGEDGHPMMPKVCLLIHMFLVYVPRTALIDRRQGMRELIGKDADKAIDDLF